MQAGKEVDAAKRDAIYKDLEMTVFDQHRPIVPLLTAKRSYAWSAPLKGVEVDASGNFSFHKAAWGE